MRAIRLVIDNSSPQLSWNPLEDLAAIFHYEFMVHAFEAGTIIAIVAGAIGYFVVLRGTAFAAHAPSHIGFPGAAGAGGLSPHPILGLLPVPLRARGPLWALGRRVPAREVGRRDLP